MDFRERDGAWFEGLFCWLVGGWLVDTIFFGGGGVFGFVSVWF